MEILDKRQMYDLQRRLALGNCLRTWSTPDEVRSSGYRGPVAIRPLKPRLGMVTHINQRDLERATAMYAASRGCGPEDMVYSEMAAPSMGIGRLLNAEAERLPGGLYLRWCPLNVHMPEAMKSATHSWRLEAAGILEYFMTDWRDLDDLEALMDMYPDAAVEFSVLDRRVGWAERQTVIWEVRNY